MSDQPSSNVVGRQLTTDPPVSAELKRKLIEIEQQASEDKGQFRLFGLFLREDASGKWDLLVAAPWIDRDTKAGLADIASRVRAKLSPEELGMLSRIVLLGANDPIVRAANQAIHVEHGSAEFVESVLNNTLIQHAIIVTST